MKKSRIVCALIAALLLLGMGAQAITINSSAYDKSKGILSWKVTEYDLVYDVYVDGKLKVNVGKDEGAYATELGEGEHTLKVVDLNGHTAEAKIGEAAPTATPTVTPTATIEPTVTVTPAPEDETKIIAITKAATKTVYLGTKYQIEVTDKKIKTCKSSKTSVAKVTAAGALTLKKAGTAKITVTLTNKKTIKLTLKVVDPTKPTKVTLDKSGTVTLYLDQTLQLNAVNSPATAADYKQTWKSSSAKIAKVNSTGLVTPVKEGTVTITVTSNSKKDTVKVKVVDRYKPTKVELDQSGTVTLAVGETLELNAVITPENATNQTLTWSSSKTSVAKVSKNGKVTAKKAGTATITVKTSNGKKDTVKIKVTK